MVQLKSVAVIVLLLHCLTTTTCNAVDRRHDGHAHGPLGELLFKPQSTNFVSSKLRRQLQTAASEQACNDAEVGIEQSNIASNGQPRVQCSCGDNGNPSGTNLFCQDACKFCKANDPDPNNGVCGSKSYGAIYDSTGQIVTTSQVFGYRQGRDEVVFIRNFGCTPDDNNNEDDAVTCTGCQVFVDGQECESCVLNTCANVSTTTPQTQTQAPSFSCESIEMGATYDACDQNLVVAQGSVFEYLTTTMGDYDVCILGGMAQNVPTATPAAASPNPTFIVGGDVCPLSIATSQCEPFIESQTPVEECDCYNYCNGVYAGTISPTRVYGLPIE
jgi:hypothetical protein